LVHDGAHEKLAELTWFCIILDLIGAALALLVAMVGAWVLAANQGWEDKEAVAVIIFTTLLVLSSRSTPTGLLRISDRFLKRQCPCNPSQMGDLITRIMVEQKIISAATGVSHC
jgi:hypothetical protein